MGGEVSKQNKENEVLNNIRVGIHNRGKGGYLQRCGDESLAARRELLENYDRK